MAPSTSSATLLVGIHSFNASATSQSTADSGSSNYALPGFVGLVTKNSQTSVATGGSNDGFYGNSTIPVPSPPTAAGDGYARILNSTLTFSFTNNTGGNYELTSFLFDFASQTGGSSASVTYRIDGGPATVVGTGPLPAVAGAAGSLANYNDLFIDLVGLNLNNLSTIMFGITASPNGRVDNVALTGAAFTPIPEPGSLLAVGCLVGSGLLLRTRRRSAAVVAASD